MGAYLSQPKVDKESEDESNHFITYGACSMQGWRMEQEDAHNAILKFESNNMTSLFAVYDGHGGPEVSQYCAQNLPLFLKNYLEKMKDDNLSISTDEGKLRSLLRLAFIEFDSKLTQPETLNELRQLAKQYDNNSAAEEESGEDPNTLLEEATAPLTEVLEKHNNSSQQTEKSQEILHSRMRRIFFEKAINNEKVQKTVKVIEAAEESEGVNSSLEITEVTEKKSENEAEEESSEDEDDADFEIGNEVEDEKSSEGESNDEEDDDEEEEEDEAEESDSGEDEENIEYSHSLWESVMNAARGSGSLDNDMSVPGEDSGSTAVIAYLRPELKWSDKILDYIKSGDEDQLLNNAILRLYVANAGDSRCILSRNGIAVDMSQDHKPDDAEELQRIERAGGAVTSEGRVNGGLNLSRAIGDHTYKKNASLPLEEQMITALPDVLTEEIHPDVDDFLVLACDGIWNSMTSQEVVDFVRQRLYSPPHANNNGQSVNGNDKESKQSHLQLNKNVSLSKICEELFEYCLAPDTSGDGTGCDNMTAIIVLLKDVRGILKQWCSDQINKNFTNDAGRKRKIDNENGSGNSNSDTEANCVKRVKLDTEEELPLLS